MTTDIAYIEHLYLLLSFSEFLRLHAVNSLSDWTPNGESFFGMHKSSVNLNYSSNISPP